MAVSKLEDISYRFCPPIGNYFGQDLADTLWGTSSTCTFIGTCMCTCKPNKTSCL